jgi:hypothetical protein
MSLSFRLIREDFDSDDSSTWEWIPDIKTKGKDTYNATGNFWSNNIRNAVCECLYLQLAYGGDDTDNRNPRDRSAQHAPRLYLDASTKVSTGFSALTTGTLDHKVCISKNIQFDEGGDEFGFKMTFCDVIKTYDGPKFSVAFLDSCSAWTTLESGFDLLLKKMRNKSLLIIEVSTRAGRASRRIPKDKLVIKHTRDEIEKKLAAASFAFHEVWNEQTRKNMHCIAYRLLKMPNGGRPKKDGWLCAPLPWHESKHGNTTPLSYYFNHWLIKPRIPERMWKHFILKMPEKAGKNYSIDLVSRVTKDADFMDGIADRVVERLQQPKASEKSQKKGKKRERPACAESFISAHYVFADPTTLPERIQKIPTESMTILNEAYHKYVLWAEEHGQPASKKNVFGKAIAAVCNKAGFQVRSFYSKRNDSPGNTRRIVNMHRKSSERPTKKKR